MSKRVFTVEYMPPQLDGSQTIAICSSLLAAKKALVAYKAALDEYDANVDNEFKWNCQDSDLAIYEAGVVTAKTKLKLTIK